MPLESPHVLVIGAGVAGLTAARRLRSISPGLRVTVVDKGRGVGGRLATRRIGAATFDHGAQFFTTHSPAFETTVQQWVRSGVAQEWFDARVGPEGRDGTPGHVRYRGSVSMNAVAKHLAEGLDVTRSCRVEAIGADGGQWVVMTAEGAPVRADAVVLTAPVPQCLDLLNAGSTHLGRSDAEALAAVRYEPCLAVLVQLDRASGLPEPGAIAPASGPVAWVADNARKGISTLPALTIHLTSASSLERWDDPDDMVVRDAVAAVGMTDIADVSTAQVQRWRYARPVRLHPEPVLVLASAPGLVVAGDAFATPDADGAAIGGTVEAAARSGSAAADAIAHLLTD